MPSYTSPYTIDPNADYNQQISKLLASEPQNRENYLNNLRNQYSYQDRMNRLEGIRKNVANTDQMLQNLPQQLQQRTSGRLMTQGQLSRLQSTETEPLARTLAQLSGSQNVEQQGLNDINSLINQAMQQRGQDVSNIYGELSTLRQNKLTADEAEMARKFQAAQNANSFSNQKKLLDYQNTLEMNKANAAKALYDTGVAAAGGAGSTQAWVKDSSGQPIQVNVLQDSEQTYNDLKKNYGIKRGFHSKGNPDYALPEGDVFQLNNGQYVYLAK